MDRINDLDELSSETRATAGGQSPSFDALASTIVATLAPRRVLALTKSTAPLVAALRRQGSMAWGIDVGARDEGEGEPPASIEQFRVVGSPSEALPAGYPAAFDLVVCIDALEQLTDTEVAEAIERMTSWSERVLLTSRCETHAASFARHSFFRDLEANVSFVDPAAVLYERRPGGVLDIVGRYETHLRRVEQELVAGRAGALRLEARLAELEGLRDEGLARQASLEDELAAGRAQADEAQLEARVASLDGQVIELGRQLREEEAEAERLRRTLAGKDAEIADLTARYEAAARACDEARIAVAALTARLEAGGGAGGDADVAALRAHIDELHRSATWRLGRLFVGPIHRARSLGRRKSPASAPSSTPLAETPDVATEPISQDAVPATSEGNRGQGDPDLHSPVPGRRRLSQHISGTGIEVGPGAHPFDLPFGGATVRYADRWRPAEHRLLVPELDAGGFPEPDIILNVDLEGLGPVDDASQDFVIASHVVEHVANPLRFLEEVHRVLRPGGVLLLLVPDKRRTFDAPRSSTPLHHVVREYEADVREVDDDHLREFLLSTSPHEIPADESLWPEVLHRHRLRSVHVHCWTEAEFPRVLEHAIAELGQRWELVDIASVADGGVDSIEFGYVLRRSTTDLPAGELARRLVAIVADVGMDLGSMGAEAHEAVGRMEGEAPHEPAQAPGRCVRTNA